MDRNEINKRIKSILVEDLFVADSPEGIADTAAIGSDLGLDSVGFVELATIVGELFEIKISDTDISQGHFADVQILTDFILARLKGKSATPMEVAAE